MDWIAYLNQPSIPIAYLRVAAEIAPRVGLDPADFVAAVPDALERLDDHGALLSPLECMQLATLAGNLGGHRGIGIAFGLAQPPTSHGHLGYAAVTSNTIREAAELVVRFATLRQPYFEFALVDDGPDHVRLTMSERSTIPLPLARTLIHEAVLVGLGHSLARVLGAEFASIDDVTLEFDFDEPPYVDEWRSRLPALRYGAPTSALRIGRAMLDVRPIFADPYAHRIALEACEHALTSTEPTADTVARTLAVLGSFELDATVSQAQVAKLLAMSSRTLSRKLQQEGTSFGDLLRRQRLENARRLLTTTDEPVGSIGAKCGYADPASFTRAFSQWAGEAPTSYRKRHAPRRAG